MRRAGVLTRLAAVLLLVGCAAQREMGYPPPRALADEEIRTAAELLRLEDRREFDSASLARFTASPSPETRRRAALAAARIGNPAGVPLLLPLLGDADTAVAATAAFGLGQLGDSAVVPSLTPLLEPEGRRQAPTVAAEAAAALGKLRGEAARNALAALLVQAAIGEAGSREVIGPALLASWKFARPADLDPILRWTQSRDEELRWRAVYALVRRPTPAATPALAGLAADPDPRVRALAVRGLTAPLADSSALGSRAALPILLTALQDPDASVRINAVRSLGTYPESAAVDALAGLVADEDPYIAWTAAESLGWLGLSAAAAAPALRATAADSMRPIAVRTAALLALAAAGPAQAEPLAVSFALSDDFRARIAAARAFARVGPVPRPEWEALARDPDPRVAAAALDARLEAAGDRPTALREVLLESLGNPDVMVRAAALRGLEKLRDPALRPLLLDAFGRAQRDTLNDAALAAIQALGPDAARAFFARFPRSPDDLVRRQAAATFGVASSAWGDPAPVTGLSAAAYDSILRFGAGSEPRVRIETERGTIDLALAVREAPLTVLNFLRLAESGYFDGQEWPRVVPNFVIQGGDPRGDTSGGPGYAIRDEINRLRYGRGTLGMALSGPDTGGSQFFITHSAQPHLDGTYTVFGRVIAGLDVVDRVLPGDRILRVSVLP